MPAFVAMARIVVEVLTLIGAAYVGALALGAVPSVVKWIVAPDVAVLMLTTCAVSYVPAAGENAGVATVAAAGQLAVKFVALGLGGSVTIWDGGEKVQPAFEGVTVYVPAGRFAIVYPGFTLPLVAVADPAVTVTSGAPALPEMLYVAPELGTLNETEPGESVTTLNAPSLMVAAMESVELAPALSVASGWSVSVRSGPFVLLGGVKEVKIVAPSLVGFFTGFPLPVPMSFAVMGENIAGSRPVRMSLYEESCSAVGDAARPLTLKFTCTGCPAVTV